MANESTTVPNFNIVSTETSNTDPGEEVATEIELVILTAYVLLCSIAVLLGNGIVFGTVYKNPKLHTQHYFLLFSYAVCDIATCLTMYPLAVMVLFQGSDVSEWFCRASSCLGVSAFYSTVYVLGMLAYERYHYFCRPLSYERFFTTRKLSCIVAAAWVFPLCFTITTEIIIGRKIFVTDLGCRLDNSKTMSLVQILTVVAPSLLVIVWSMACIGATWLKMRAKVAPQVVERDTATDTYLPVEGLSKKYRVKTSKVGTAFKLIILVSGLFWGTYIPGFIAKSVITSSGVTWEEMETRQNLTAMFVLRYRNFLIGTVSQTLNPLLYLYTHPELRTAVKQLIGCSCGPSAP